MNALPRALSGLLLLLAAVPLFSGAVTAPQSSHAPAVDAQPHNTEPAKTTIEAHETVSTAGRHVETHAIEEALKTTLPGIKPDSITASPVPGLYEVAVGPKIIYVTADGHYMVQGAIIDAKAREDITEPRVAVARLKSLKKFGAEQMITFSPKLKKYDAYVFTDIDCGYCRKLHSEIDQYLAQGIAVHYLFFPRAGEGSDSWKKAESVWCAADHNAALTQAKKGQSLPEKTCKNPVADQYALGNSMGVQGTPMIITGKGAILPGYVNAEQLANMMQYEEQK